MPTIFILRHRRENLKKCSLTGLEGKPGLSFSTYPIDPLPNLSESLLLKVSAPPITSADFKKDFLLIDGTWRLAAIMEKQLPIPLEARSIPGSWQTAYPRRQTDCPDPHAGLSSVETLYVIALILGRCPEGILDRYYWKEDFLQVNKEQISKLLKNDHSDYRGN
jgi:pre-rRNA-processing protein TSR3